MFNEHKKINILLNLITSGGYDFQCRSFRTGEMKLLCECDFYTYAYVEFLISQHLYAKFVTF